MDFFDNQNLANRFAFNQRQFFIDTTGVTNVGIGAKVELFSNQLTIPVAINQAVRIVRATCSFVDAAQSEDVAAGVGNIFLLSHGLFVAQFPASNPAPIKLGGAGLAMIIEDEIVYGTDFSSIGFAPPAILIGACLNVVGGAAAHNITNVISVIWETYDLKPDAPLRG